MNTSSRDQSPLDGGVREPVYVREALRDLTRTQRAYVMRGSISGDPTMAMVRSLQRKGLFYLHIDSPNGRCGFMRLTPLGVTVQAILKGRTASPAERPVTGPGTTQSEGQQ